MAGKFVEIMNGEDAESHQAAGALKLANVATNAHQSVLLEHLI